MTQESPKYIDLNSTKPEIIALKVQASKQSVWNMYRRISEDGNPINPHGGAMSYDSAIKLARVLE